MKYPGYATGVCVCVLTKSTQSHRDLNSIGSWIELKQRDICHITQESPSPTHMFDLIQKHTQTGTEITFRLNIHTHTHTHTHAHTHTHIHRHLQFSCSSRTDLRASAVQSDTIQPQSAVLNGNPPCTHTHTYTYTHTLSLTFVMAA